MLGNHNDGMIAARKPALRKIVFVNRYYDPDRSATSQMLTDLAQGLAARGLPVEVITSGQLYDDPDASLPKEETLAGVRVRRVATTRFGRATLPGRAIDYFSFYVSCALKLFAVLRRCDTLIVKTDPPLLSIIAAPIAKLLAVQLINWQQDIFPEVATRLGANPLPAWLDGCLKWLRDASLRSARMNVLIGARMRDYLQSRGIPVSKLCVIENWSSAIQPRPPGMSVLRGRLALADRCVVCYSGNLGRAHEFDTLLEAAKALKDSSAFTFLFIGSGAKMDALRGQVESLGLTESFRFLPYQPRDALEDSLAAADVHLASLLPALEGLIVPSKLYGILAAGRPVIFIGDTEGDVSRVVRRAQCGRTVCVGDSAGLVEALRELQAQPQTRAAMGRRAREMFCREFSLERAIARWMAVIEAVDEPSLLRFDDK
jgi:colanic acid biosynthesis glycosyl transferase WcaI